MITRGHYIGQIVDDLSDIANQAKQRGRLHLFDIHIHVENFAKEILNRVLDLNLLNLNEERSNNPGLDLGDRSAGWAFQVTADKSRAKIEETLEKIDIEQRKIYNNVVILVIGEKQGSYSLDKEPFKSFGFTEDMIWDFTNVCARLMNLSIDRLADLAKYVALESRRVRIELEIPDQEGKYPTNIDSWVEQLAHPKLSDAARLNEYWANKNDPIDISDAVNCILRLSKTLVLLPRITREVFAFMLERRDPEMASDSFRISDQKLRRIYFGDDLTGDLALLSESGLIDLNEPDDTGRTHYWRMHFFDKIQPNTALIVEFIEKNGLSLRKALVNLDFSDL